MTKPIRWFPGLLCAFLGVAVFAVAGDEGKPAAGSKTKSAARAAMPVVRPADKLEWKDAPGVPGVKIAVLWGDPAKGPHAAIHKFPAGFKAPLHTHSADLRCVIISGTIIHGEKDGTQTPLGPGSYLMDPHTEVHTTACDPASECEMFVQASGKFDIKPYAARAMEKKEAAK